MRGTWAIIPVKSLAAAKQRLAPVLPPDVRRRLVITMLTDVLEAVAEVREVVRCLVVTPDDTVVQLAEEKGAHVLREMRARGLNAAVRAGLAFASSKGAMQALMLPGDVPLATPDELRSLANSAANGPAQATLAPAADGEGTNGLLLAPPDAMEPSFGPGSYMRHLSQAVARRLDVQVLHLPGLAADIDRPQDLCGLLAPGPGLRRFQFLAEHVMNVAESGERVPGADGRC